MFQSLIGTVQQQCLLRFLFSLYPIFPVFQSFSPKKSVNLFIVNSRKALILLAFLFLSKLARRFTDFSAAFLLFSALFHAVFVLEALILLPWRFTDFFYRFFNNLCFNQRKSSSPLTKTEASFEYLNHTRNPAFAVHPCPSPIFCHQEDKSELRGATPNFLPQYRNRISHAAYINLCGNAYPQISPFFQKFSFTKSIFDIEKIIFKPVIRLL